MNFANQLRSDVARLTERREALKAEASRLDSDLSLSTDEHNARVEALLSADREVRDEIAAKRARIEELDALAAERSAAPVTLPGSAAQHATSPTFWRKQNPWGTVSQNSEERRAQALSCVERMAGPDEKRQAITVVLEEAREETHGDLARWAIATSSDDYLRAFTKVLADPQRGHLDMTADEHRAYERVRQFTRAAMSNTDANGGYLSLPLIVDPAVSGNITSAGTTNPLGRLLARQEVITGTDTYRVPFTAGVTASWDAELSVVSDDSPTFDVSDIKAAKWSAFVSASYELVQDYSRLAAEMAVLFQDAADNLEATALMAGSGTNEPWGLVTRLDATTTSEVSVTTGGSFAWADVIKLDNALPARFRDGAAFLATRAVQNIVRGFGAGASATAAEFWVDARGGLPASLLGQPIYEATEGLVTSVTTTGQNIAVLGNYAKAYTVVRRAPTTIVPIPVLFDSTTGRPNGSQGWYVYGRTGGDTVARNAARLLKS